MPRKPLSGRRRLIPVIPAKAGIHCSASSLAGKGNGAAVGFAGEAEGTSNSFHQRSRIEFLVRGLVSAKRGADHPTRGTDPPAARWDVLARGTIAKPRSIRARSAARPSRE